MPPDYGSIIIGGGRENNLKNVSLDIPKRRITVPADLARNGKTLTGRYLSQRAWSACLLPILAIQGRRVHER